jgi:hypothetical protein
VLTIRAAEKSLASWSVAHVGAAITLSVIALSPAFAGGVAGLSCVRGAKTFNCVGQWANPGDPYVRTVPEVLGDAEKAQASARDHKWLTRCRPVVERDNYGVARYQYSEPGCEYGLGAD